MRPIFIRAVALLLLVSLVCLAYLGTFTRFLADDFCMAGDALGLGLAGMLAKWYVTWTGRFMFILGTGLFGLGGPKMAGWLPPLALAVWLGGLAWAVYPLIKRSGWPQPRGLALSTAGLSLLVVLSSTPNLYQSFYWQNGMVNYSLPLMGLVFCGGILLRTWLEQPRLLPAGICVFFLAFLSGGFTEAFTAMQVTLLLLALLAALLLAGRNTRRRLIPILSAALAGALVALLIVVIAPGNQVRMQAVGGQAVHPGLVRIFTFSVRNMAHIFGKYFILTPFWAFVSIVPPFLTGWLLSTPLTGKPTGWSLSSLWKRPWVKGGLWLSGSALILVTAACAPVVYALNAYPDERTIIIPQFVITVSAIGVSSLLGVGLRQQGVLGKLGENLRVNWLLPAGILAIVLISTGATLYHTVQQAPEYRSYAETWDAKDADIRQAALSGASEITVNGGYGRFGVADINIEPENWVNRCMAFYYNIPQIRGR